MREWVTPSWILGEFTRGVCGKREVTRSWGGLWARKLVCATAGLRRASTMGERSEDDSKHEDDIRGVSGSYTTGRRYVYGEWVIAGAYAFRLDERVK